MPITWNSGVLKTAMEWAGLLDLFPEWQRFQSAFKALLSKSHLPLVFSPPGSICMGFQIPPALVAFVYGWIVFVWVSKSHQPWWHSSMDG
jgi:hypothetical protein